MKLRDLPGFSNLYLDLIDQSPAVSSVFAALADTNAIRSRMEFLASRSFPRESIRELLVEQACDFGCGERSLANIQRLGEGRTAVVLVRWSSSFPGAMLVEYLKLLTALRLTAELAEQGVPVVPLCLIPALADANAESRAIHLLDADSKPRKVMLAVHETEFRSAMESLLTELVGIYGLGIQSETLSLLRACIPDEGKQSTFTGRLIAALFKDWGVIPLDVARPRAAQLAGQVVTRPGTQAEDEHFLLSQQRSYLRSQGYMPEPAEERTSGVRNLQSVLWMLPVAVQVVDHADVLDLAMLAPLFEKTRQPGPPVRPRASATLVEMRSKKVMERYSVTFADLFQGVDSLVRRAADEGDIDKVTGRLEGLAAELTTELEDVLKSVSEDNSLAGLVTESSERMIYQIGRIKERFASSGRQRREVMFRQLRRVSNGLAPAGRLQEMSLSGLHFLLRYSTACCQNVYDNINLDTLEHQLILVE